MGTEPLKKHAFNIMLKPIGPVCNLDCTYCYYLEKKQLYPYARGFRINDDILEIFIKEYIESQPVPIVTFVWQGGEPTLLGIDFFRKALDMQKKHARGKRIENVLQTNGTLLTEAFCEFLGRNDFLVGLSIDGPRELHDRYRLSLKGEPSWEKVMNGLKLLHKYKVEFNTLTVVNDVNSRKPLEVYRFLKDIGSQFMQFIPIAERYAANPGEEDVHLVHHEFPGEAQVTSWSVKPARYGQFLISIFDEWVREDVGRYYVQLFDVTLANWAGEKTPGLCVFSETCGDAAVMEHNGDVYACDHFVYHDHFLGNIKDHGLAQLMYGAKQTAFGLQKKEKLPRQCRECEYVFACHGECPKHRFATTPDGEPGLNYLCGAYKMFFAHVKPYMDYMVEQLRANQAPANVMQWMRENKIASSTKSFQVGPNDVCPCGSGRKFKQCCA